MRVKRRNPYIDEAVDVLDMHLQTYRGDVKDAFLHLSKDENEFIDGELKACILNPRYYLENYHIVQTEYEGLKTLYPFWDSQEIFYNEIVTIQHEGRPVKIIVLKARQLGISTVSEGLVFHKTIFTEGCNTLIVAQDPGQADFLFGMSRLAYDSLPWWMRPEERYQAKGRYLILDKKDDLERQFRPGLKSQMLVEAANKMTGVARGKTIRAAHMSELASWASGGILSQSIFPTMNAPDELAICESTAEGRTGFWYRFWKDAVSGKIDWHPLFIEYFRVRKYSKPIKDTVTFRLSKEEISLREKIEKRCGFHITDATFNWVRAKKQEFVTLEGDEWKFYQEYPLGWQEAFQGSGICAFPKRLLQKILEGQCCDPLWYGEIEFDLNKPIRDRITLRVKRVEAGDLIPEPEQIGGRLRMWEMPQEGDTYYLAADVAHGLEGGDYSCVQILKIGHGQEPDEQVAEWRGWINPTPFGNVIAALGYMYNEAQIAIECNDVGITTNNQVYRVIEYENIYRWKHVDKIKNFLTDFFGWYTNSKTRDAIISKFREGIMERTIILRSEALIDECMDFSQDEDGGRFEGQETNDDRIMAMMIAYYCAHDSDFGRQAAAQPRSESSHPDQVHFVFDTLGRQHGQYSELEEAVKIVDQNPGWTYRSTLPRRDRSNTEYSPVYDTPGIRQRMHYDLGFPAETIRLDSMVATPERTMDDDWRNW